MAATAPSAPVADAAEKADWPRVAALVREHTDVKAAQADGTTALHWAAYHDNRDSTRLLLDAGADAKAANRYGVTPLAPACTNGNADIVKLLLTAGADPNIRDDKYHATALGWADFFGRSDFADLIREKGGAK